MIRAGLWCGVAAPILWATVIIVAGELRPGFDHVGQYISELGERGSSHSAFMRLAGFAATGLMHICYAVAFYAAVRRMSGRTRLALLVAVLVALDGAGRIGAGLFSCEPGCRGPDTAAQHLHHLSATVAFLSIASAACLGGILFRSSQRLRCLALYSLISGLAGLAFLGLMQTGGAFHAYVGLFERLASGVFTLWVSITALRLSAVSVRAAGAPPG